MALRENSTKGGILSGFFNTANRDELNVSQGQPLDSTAGTAGSVAAVAVDEHANHSVDGFGHSKADLVRQ
jgi:hypothetical protein